MIYPGRGKCLVAGSQASGWGDGWCLTRMEHRSHVRGWSPTFVLVCVRSLLVLLIQTQDAGSDRNASVRQTLRLRGGLPLSAPVLLDPLLPIFPPARMLPPSIFPGTPLYQRHPLLRLTSILIKHSLPPFLCCSHFSAPQKYYFIQRVCWL